MSILDVRNVKKIYTTRFSNQQTVALKNISFTVDEGEYVAIMGESGSGKTTLLNILAGLDRPTSGCIYLNKQNMIDIHEKDLSSFRRKHLGFVFQDFYLLDTFHVKDNILLPMVLSNEKKSVMEERLKSIVKNLDIERLLLKYPYEISGGQKQRVAVARALINYPDLILADEPTGALDSRTSDELLDLFDQVNQCGQTIIMVTHSIKAASRASRVLFIKDGEIYHIIDKDNKTYEQMYQHISKVLSSMETGGIDNEK